MPFFTFSWPKDVSDLSRVPWMHLFWSFSAITTGTYPSTDYLGHAIEVGHHGMEHAGEAVATSPAGANWSGIVLFSRSTLSFL